MKKEYYKDLKVSPSPRSLVIIEGEIPASILDAEYEAIFKEAIKSIEVPGFRAGKAPEHLAKSQISEAVVLDKAAEAVFKKEYSAIIEYHKLFPINHPEIQITKLAAGNPLGFKITVAVMPKIELPDYKKIAKSQKTVESKTEVTEADIDKAITEVKKMWAHQQYHKDHPEDTSHNHNEELPLPEVNDEFVKQLGDFKDLADFRAKLKQNLEQEAIGKIKEKTRIALVEAMEKDFSIDLPDILVEGELDKMISDLHGRIASAGIKPTDYFEQAGKKEDELRKEWRPDAEKRTKIEIILTEIARKEGIKPDPKDVEEEMKKILSYYKDADPMRARSYVEHMLSNDKVFEYLESLK